MHFGMLAKQTYDLRRDATFLSDLVQGFENKFQIFRKNIKLKMYP